jgi:MFS family permease
VTRTVDAGRWAREAGQGLTAGLPANRFDGPLDTRPATELEASGRRILLKAAAMVILGGLIIAGVSAMFSTSLFAPDIRMAGLFMGLVVAGIGLVSVVDPDTKKMIHGVIAIAIGVVAMPIALGGYIIGSLAAIVGGAMLVAYQPPDGPLAVEVEHASYPRRLLALLTDFVVALVVQRILYFIAGWFFVNTLNVMLSWIVVWFLVVVEPSILTRRTVGRLLVSTRVADVSSADRATTVGTIVRESIRGVIAIGAMFMIAGATLQSSFRVGAGLLMAVIVVGLVALFEGFGLLDRLSGTAAVYERIVPAPPDPGRGADVSESNGEETAPSGTEASTPAS